MRFLGVTETCDLGALYLRLIEEGHEVRVSISEPLARGTLAGMVEKVPDWRHELAWVGTAERDGIILFEAVSEGLGALQDQLRREGYRVIGGSAFGDRLENDRGYAMAMLADLGLPIARVTGFSSLEDADAFIEKHPSRYVLKYSGPDFSGSNFVGQFADGRDVRAILASRQAPSESPTPPFILMDYVDGVEMGVGAYFNGEHFLRPACLDWEHKRFFAGDLGELTGEMGTVATYERSQIFFERTLGRMESLLREHRHVGYVNLNTIVNAAGIWPLEFTCRFGYPGFAVLAPLQGIGWGELLHMIGSRSSRCFPVDRGYSVGVVLTTPPFPYSRKQVAEPVGLPLMLPGRFQREDMRHIHFGEVGRVGDQWITSGLYGWTCVVTGTGVGVGDAQRDAYARIADIIVPNGRYRLDIGDRLVGGDLAAVEALGLLGP